MTGNEIIRNRLSEAGLCPPDDEISRLSSYVDLLARWNHTINLTALRVDPLTPQAVDRLIVEPAAAAGILASMNQGGLWFDFGSGGGSPAIPLKILGVGSPLHLVEARSRKAAFLRRALDELGMKDATVECCRLESLQNTNYIGLVGLITVRAVAMGEAACASAVKLLGEHGVLGLFSSAGEETALAGFRRVSSHKLSPASASLEIYQPSR